MPSVMKRGDIDAQVAKGCCECGGRHPTVIASKCHPHVPLTAEYLDGMLRLSCAMCSKTVALVEVAE